MPDQLQASFFDKNVCTYNAYRYINEISAPKFPRFPPVALCE